MVDLNQTIRLLQGQREELLAQLDAVDRALSALSALTGSPAGVQTNTPESDAPAAAVTVTKVRPKRVLSDTHRQALIVGRRKAVHAKEVAAGRAREALDDSYKPAPGDAAPRLVKPQK